MRKFINKVKAYFVEDYTKTEEYKMALWEHEQLGYKIYSLELTLEKLKKERNESMSA